MKLHRPHSRKVVTKTQGLTEPLQKLAEKVYFAKTGNSSGGSSSGRSLNRRGTSANSRTLDRTKSVADKGTGKVVPTTDMMALEVSSIMRSCLDMWKLTDDSQIRKLRDSLQDTGLVMLVHHDPDVLWAVAGLEVMQKIEAIAKRVMFVGTKCDEPNLHKLKETFAHMRDGQYDYSAFQLTHEETVTLFSYMQEQVQQMNELKKCMVRISQIRCNLKKNEGKAAAPPSLLADLEAAEGSGTSGDGNADSDSDDDDGAPIGGNELFDMMSRLTELQSETMWSADLDHIARLLVLAVFVLRGRFFGAFGGGLDFSEAEKLEAGSLGTVGLSTRFAKIILQMEKILSYPFMAAGATRDNLYTLLPAEVRKGMEQMMERQGLKIKRQKKKRIGSSIDQPSADRQGGYGERDVEEEEGEEDEDEETSEAQLRWWMSVLPKLAKSTLAWDDANTVQSGPPRPNPGIFKVQTLHMAQTDIVMMILTTSLVRLTRFVVADGGHKVQVTSRKAERLQQLQQEQLKAATAAAIPTHSIKDACSAIKLKLQQQQQQKGLDAAGVGAMKAAAAAAAGVGIGQSGVFRPKHGGALTAAAGGGGGGGREKSGGAGVGGEGGSKEAEDKDKGRRLILPILKKGGPPPNLLEELQAVTNMFSVRKVEASKSDEAAPTSAAVSDAGRSSSSRSDGSSSNSPAHKGGKVAGGAAGQGKGETGALKPEKARFNLFAELEAVSEMYFPKSPRSRASAEAPAGSSSGSVSKHPALDRGSASAKLVYIERAGKADGGGNRIPSPSRHPAPIAQGVVRRAPRKDAGPLPNLLEELNAVDEWVASEKAGGGGGGSGIGSGSSGDGDSTGSPPKPRTPVVQGINRRMPRKDVGPLPNLLDELNAVDEWVASERASSGSGSDSSITGGSGSSSSSSTAEGISNRAPPPPPPPGPPPAVRGIQRRRPRKDMGPLPNLLDELNAVDEMFGAKKAEGDANTGRDGGASAAPADASAPATAAKGAGRGEGAGLLPGSSGTRRSLDGKVGGKHGDDDEGRKGMAKEEKKEGGDDDDEDEEEFVWSAPQPIKAF